MRIVLSLFLCSFLGCDDGPGDPESPARVEVETQVEEANEAALVPAAPAVEMTTGFIQATINGEVTRFEHLRAHDNQVLTRVTMLEAHTGPDQEHGIRITLTGIDVRDVEFPAVFQRDVVAARRNIAAAGRMAVMSYTGADDKTYGHLFSNDELQCQSFDNSVLKCTFHASAESRDGRSSAEITDGTLEIGLMSDATTDAIIDSTVGALADESEEQVQQGIDRLEKQR